MMINTTNLPPYHPVKVIPLDSLPLLDGLKNIFTITDVLNQYKRSITFTYNGDCLSLHCIVLCHKFHLQVDEHQTRLIIYSGSEDVEDDRAILLSLLSDTNSVMRRRDAPQSMNIDHGSLLTDIGDLLRFLRFLRERGHHFFVKQSRDDSIMVTITLETSLIEVDFFEDHIEYSLFQRDGASDNDQQRMIDLLAWFVRD
jgi:hypothetical protein